MRVNKLSGGDVDKALIDSIYLSDQKVKSSVESERLWMIAKPCRLCTENTRSCQSTKDQ